MTKTSMCNWDLAFVGWNQAFATDLKQAFSSHSHPPQLHFFDNLYDLTQALDAGTQPHLIVLTGDWTCPSNQPCFEQIRSHCDRLGGKIILHVEHWEQVIHASSQGIHDVISDAVSSARLVDRLNLYLAGLEKSQNTKSSGLAASRAVGASFLQLRQELGSINESAVGCLHIAGETGTGKEMVAQLLKPTFSLDCGTLSEDLIESELFGSIKGSYTGSTADRRGLLDLSEGEWVFLDEIANIGPRIQKALLRALGEREIRPVGSRKVKKVHFKLITATNEDLAEKVKRGEFREDLYQRISEYTIRLAPLSERRDEINDLLDHFCRDLEGGPYKLDSLTRRVLQSYDYPNGNIRELRRILVGMSVYKLADGTLPFSAIPRHIVDAVSQPAPVSKKESAAAPAASPLTLSASPQKLEIVWKPGMSWIEMSNDCLAQAIRKTCMRKPHSLRELAPLLGLQRSTLSRKVTSLHKEGRLSKQDLDRCFKHGVTEQFFTDDEDRSQHSAVC